MKRQRIFIVDDDQDFAESLAEVLELQGYEVELAFSGEEAVQKFGEQNFDLTFMDVRLPGKNGVESFLEVRQLKPDAKVVMMTGHSVEQLLEQAIKNGAWAVLHKPLEMEKVLSMVRKITPHGIILIADDDPAFADSIQELLEQNGYTVFIAHNGREAVERVRSDGIDMLILDLRLPILNGLEVYLELKTTSHAVPTLIVTAYAREEADALDILRSISVKGFLTKPFDPRDLLQATEHLIRPKGEGRI
ncbi:MAG: response regulator [Nitrospira sp.]|nr:response regulator [Nitrospira sp.]